MKKNVNPPSIFKKIVEVVEITRHIKALKSSTFANKVIQTLDVLVLNYANVY